jgi:DNA topoisomerase-1
MMLAETDPPIRTAPQAAPGVVYVTPDEPGIVRLRAGRGFAYRGPDQARIDDREVIGRIRSLAVPPAWRDVWICPRPNGHIQAIGYDSNGRRQYRYHPRFREVREGAKYEHMLAFAEALPALRERIASDMRKRGLGRDKVLATVVHLLEATMIRVGNQAYARENKSYGLTTLRDRHVEVEGGELRFHFKGKSGKVWRLGLHDRRVANVIRSCQELPGQHLFQYLDDEGEPQAVTSADINAYLREAAGGEITAKDFRTWAGTVLAAEALARSDPPGSAAEAKRRLNAVIKEVAVRLGNTPAICRKCYVHPRIAEAWLNDGLRLDLPDPKEAGSNGTQTGSRPEEAAVLDFLRSGARRRSGG